MITRTLVHPIANPVPSINVSNSVTISNPQGSGSITYAIDGGGAISLKNGESVTIHHLDNINQFTFGGSGNVDIVYYFTFEPLIVRTPSTITGTRTVGQTLTCNVGTIQSQTNVTTTYQWLRNGAVISGATNSTYVLVAADAGMAVSCQLRHFNTNGANASEQINTVINP